MCKERLAGGEVGRGEARGEGEGRRWRARPWQGAPLSLTPSPAPTAGRQGPPSRPIHRTHVCDKHTLGACCLGPLYPAVKGPGPAPRSCGVSSPPEAGCCPPLGLGQARDTSDRWNAAGVKVHVPEFALRSP